MYHCQETSSTGGARPKIKIGENASSPEPQGILEGSEGASSIPLPVVAGERKSSACESDKNSWESDFEWRTDSGSSSSDEKPIMVDADEVLVNRTNPQQNQTESAEATGSDHSFNQVFPDPLTVSPSFTRAYTFQLNREQVDRIMDSNFPLTDKHINFAAEILKRHFPRYCINGVTRVPIYDSGCIYPYQVDASYSPAVNFHWAEKHWTVSFMEDGVVYYLDSDKDRKIKESDNDKCKQIRIPPSVTFHLGQLYKVIVNIKIKCSQQIGKLDCGPLSIAQAVEFCHNPKITNFMINFDQSQLRSHLKLCFENRSFGRFPKLEFNHTNKI